MTKLEIYEQALKRLAEKGSTDAALVLQIAGAYDAAVDGDAKLALSNALGLASAYATSALTAGSDWGTTEAITTTIKHITTALQQLSRM